MSELISLEQEADRLHDIASVLNSGSVTSAKRLMQAMKPSEIADLLESTPTNMRQLIWGLVDENLAGDVLIDLGEEVRESIVRDMDVSHILKITEDMDLDDLADFIQSLPETLTSEVLLGMNKQNRQRLETVLLYDEDSAGGLMDLDVVTVRADVTLDVVLRYLRMRGDLPESTDRLFVVDRYDDYLGVLPLRRLLTNDPDTLVASLMRDDLDPILANTPADKVVKIFEDLDLVSAPVVDDNGKLLGRITIDDVVDVIREDAEQQVRNMAGLSQEDDIFGSVWRSARKRAVWLGINLLTAFLAASVISQFEAVIEQVVALAALLPIVASMGGIAGSQTLTLVVRGQALGQISRTNTRWLLSKEVLVSIINGILWAIVVGGLTYLWFGDIKIGAIIAAAMSLNLVVAAFAGVMIPVLMKQFGIDPALAGGVVLTTVTDVIGFLAFLGLASLILL